MIKRILICGLVILGVQTVRAESFVGQASFSETKCPFVIPSGERAKCGYLTVLESRGNQNGNKIKLFITIVKSHSHQPKTDPIVFLVGDPDPAPSTQLAKGNYWRDLAPLRQDRDMIFIDQRGSGLSEPNLMCKDLHDPHLISKEDFLIGLKNCRDKFAKRKINLALYNSKESALDVLAPMRALHYKQWNILATSFGSRVALGVMSIKPQHVRSVVLNSAVPLIPAANSAEMFAANNERVFKQLFYDCGVSSECRKSFPNLSDVYLQLIRTLPNTNGGDKISAPYVVSVLSYELANENALHYLPKTIFELSQTNAKGGLTYDNFKTILQKHHIDMPHVTMSYHCFDIGDMQEKNKEKKIQDSSFYTNKVTDDCSIWGKGAALKVFEKTTYPAIPTMILAGEYDTVSPMQWSRDVAKVLPNAKLFQFKGVGNDVIRSVHCAMFMATAFFDRPDHRPEDACIAALKPPTFPVSIDKPEAQK